MVTIGISEPEGGEKYKMTIEEYEKSMEEVKRYYATNNEITYFFNNEYNKKEYDDLDERSINGERFIHRNYLSDFYSQLTDEQKKFLAKFHVLLGSAIREDSNDKEYNLKNYDELNNKFSMKGGIKWKI